MLTALRTHWPEYLMESVCLGAFMVSACIAGTLLEHPASPLAQRIEKPLVRHLIAGLSMALTALAIFFSPMGKRSGAHMNPAVTITFYRLGKVELWDAIFYMVAQTCGGIAGVGLAEFLIGPPLSHSSVNYVSTVPGVAGATAAFIAELLISAVMMTMVLHVSNRKALARYTPFFAAVLIAAYITLESPVSGMSMNPARTLASAAHSHDWTAIWIYFIAPPAGMLLAARGYLLQRGRDRVFCAKFHHENQHRCIFRCGYGDMK